MREQVRASLVQFSPRAMNEKEWNTQFIIDKIRLLSKDSELIVFPEMSVTNFFEHSGEGKLNYWRNGAILPDDELLQQIALAAKEENVYTVVGFAERSHEIGKIYNSTILIGPEGPIGITRKIHFPGLEKLYFSPGTDIPVFDTPIGKIGMSICYDSWFPEHVRILAAKGAEIVVISASIWKGGMKGGIGHQGSKEVFWDKLPIVKAIENQVFIVACNGGGEHFLGESVGRWERMGMSKIVSPLGEVLASAPGNGEEFLTARLEREVLEQGRASYAFLIDRAPAMYKDLCE